MNELWWMLIYLIGAVVTGLMFDEDGDTMGETFVQTFCWPLPIGALITTWLWSEIAMSVNRLVDMFDVNERKD